MDAFSESELLLQDALESTDRSAGACRARSCAFATGVTRRSQRRSWRIETRNVSHDPELMDEALLMTAAAYRELSPGERGLSLDHVHSEICGDPYQVPCRSRTIAAFATGLAGAEDRIAGLVRVVFGSTGTTDRLAPIDAMNFVAPIAPWPHEQAGARKIAELGRYVIDREFRSPELRRAGVPQAITRSLLQAAVDLIRPMGIGFLYAIMPDYAARLVLDSGIRLESVPCVMRTEDPSARRVFDDYATYWHRSEPRLYRVAEA